jgi:hypothetical protein
MNLFEPNYNIPCRKTTCSVIENVYEDKLNYTNNYFKNISGIA